jgi:ketosteroid isomerase-like protein
MRTAMENELSRALDNTRRWRAPDTGWLQYGTEEGVRRDREKTHRKKESGKMVEKLRSSARQSELIYHPGLRCKTIDM